MVGGVSIWDLGEKIFEMKVVWSECGAGWLLALALTLSVTVFT